MLFQNAAVHHDEQASLTRLPGSRFMNDAFLHPDGARADANGRLHNRWNEFRSPEHIHDVDRLRNRLQIRVRFLSQHFFEVRIYGDDPVSGALHVLRHAVAWAKPPCGEADDGDGAAGPQEFFNGHPLQSYPALMRLVFAILAPLTAWAQPYINTNGVVNAASFTPPDLPGGALARGRLFTIFGRQLGPATGVSATSFPLGTTLSGVSIRVFQGTTTVDAIPVFVSAGQINAIMPSNAPLGRSIQDRLRPDGTAAYVAMNLLVSQPPPARVVMSVAYHRRRHQHDDGSDGHRRHAADAVRLTASSDRTYLFAATGRELLVHRIDLKTRRYAGSLEVDTQPPQPPRWGILDLIAIP